MPRIDGYGLIRQIRALGPSAQQLPALAVTAHARPQDEQQAMAAGFQMYVANPIDPEVLVQRVAALAGQRMP